MHRISKDTFDVKRSGADLSKLAKATFWLRSGNNIIPHLV